MNAITKKLAVGLLAILAMLIVASQAGAAAAPAWRFDVTAYPTNLVPGSSYAESSNEGEIPQYHLLATNVGTAPTSGPVTMTDTFPEGITPIETWFVPFGSCTISGQEVTCVFPSTVRVGEARQASIGIAVDGTDTILHEGDTVFDQATLSGGGAGAVVASNTSTVSSATAPSGFLTGSPGLGMTPYGADGSTESRAGGHPGVLSVNLGFASTKIGRFPAGVDGGVNRVDVALPRGLIFHPDATPKCNEAQLEGFACPPATQVGRVNVATVIVSPVSEGTDLNNMVPPPGKAGSVGLNLLGFATHIEGSARAGDYTIATSTRGIPDLFARAVLGTQLLFWGDPSSPSFDVVRGLSTFNGGCGEYTVTTCPVTPQDKAYLSLPTSCAEEPVFEGTVYSWEHQSIPANRNGVMRDANDNPIGITECAGLEFNPTLKARPTTNVADSPSGLEFDLEVPQTESLSERSTAHLKDVEVSLPEGMSLNPASANGLAGCSPSQVGIDPDSAVADGNPVSCPDASRIGSVEVDSGLVDHPLLGSVYVATPYDNPFDSLLAIYAVVDDPISGTLIKLPGHVAADPNTGRLVSTFDNNPQLPFGHFKIDFFGGAHGVLRTPSTCGSYSSTSSLTPWSAPDSGPPATPHDDYAISTPPAGGSCGGSLPNSPSLDAGVLSPIAAHYSPFVLHLRRSDGSQQFSSFSAKLPPGLTGKLAGVGQCSDAALAAAASKSGAQEQASPSCPPDSHLGSVVAGAGAGPSPYYAHGDAYLAGPYKGAPLSMAVITPAVAGPYDLGTIVVRAALYLDPSTGQIDAVSDQIPSILQGIPLDVRSIDLNIDRSDFTRTGTSCDPSAVLGQLTSTLGQVVPLTERYQLGECTGLAFKPKLAIRLFGGTKRGAHPALRGSVQMPEGGANIAQASVALPHSEFLDQAHIGTVCTRVQFAEGDGNGSACPADSVYGHASATSPLVDYALEGNAYLRSSSHELPDLVVALHGPPSQPIAVDVVGRIDSVKGGIRTTFEGVPDLPVSSFVLNMRGAKKGLLQNSTNICRGKHKATAEFDAQNGKALELSPALKNGKCAKAKRRHKRGHSHHRRGAGSAR